MRSVSDTVNIFNRVGLKCGNYEGAIATASSALILSPNTASALHIRGTALMQLCRLKEAKKDLVLAARLQPQDRRLRAAAQEAVRLLLLSNNAIVHHALYLSQLLAFQLLLWP